ncbi:solute carrier family 66 member 3-like [Gigantopelta aegis]|uniref:solute carrier family 66 member 3-like n=1 Tax=Gigantopelta aegis TaxID=1735272 RepID=UPI001B88A1A7|nr:solute carrier family 66 member 3-like [Gigantopelta aegis]
MLRYLCDFLSLTVVATCIILKVPQILSVSKAKSSKGVSLGSVLLEECGYSIMLTYQFAMEYPVSTYCEYGFLVLQDLTLILLILHYSSGVKVKFLPLFAIYFVCCVAIAFRFLPDVLLTTVISLVTPISAGSKLIQIAAILKSQDAGSVSPATWAMASYTTIVRSLTTVVLTGDVAILTNFASSATLNLLLTYLVLRYRRTDKKKTT